MHYEVIVIGGGLPVWAPAVSAARQGCTTALLEEKRIFRRHGHRRSGASHQRFFS